MAYVAPVARSAGYKVTAARWNADVVDNVLFLANPPACRVRNSVAISVADNTTTVLTFDSERYDTNTMHSTSTNTGRITFTTAGIYLVGGSCEIAPATDYSDLQGSIRLNGATTLAQFVWPVWAQGSFAPPIVLATTYKFAAGDYIEFLVRHDNTANAARNVLATGNWSPEFYATWVGLG